MSYPSKPDPSKSESAAPPTGVRLTPYDDAFLADPYRVWQQARAAGPAYPDPEFGRLIVTDFEEVKRVLRDRAMWSDPRKAADDSFTAQFRDRLTREDRQPSMLFLDDPDHKRLRSLVNKAFTPAAVETRRSHIAKVAAGLVDALDPSGFDLIAGLAGPLPAIVIAEMLGIDGADHGRFKAWSDASTAAFFNPFRTPEDEAAAAEAQEHLDALFRREIERRRAQPGADLTSAMVNARDGDDRLSDNEIVTQCNLLLVAGNVTTTDLIGNGTKALLEHPDQLARLRAEPTLLENAIEEMLRFDSPVTQSGRIAHQDLKVGGCPVKAGHNVSVSLAAANRDPSVYPDPESFDVARENVSHQSFGGGSHFCLGAPLARVEAQEAIRALLARFSTLELVGFEYRRLPGFRGLTSLRLSGEAR